MNEGERIIVWRIETSGSRSLLSDESGE